MWVIILPFYVIVKILFSELKFLDECLVSTSVLRSCAVCSEVFVRHWSGPNKTAVFRNPKVLFCKGYVKYTALVSFIVNITKTVNLLWTDFITHISSVRMFTCENFFWFHFIEQVTLQEKKTRVLVSLADECTRRLPVSMFNGHQKPPHQL